MGRGNTEDLKPTSEQVGDHEIIRDEKGRFVPGFAPNPSGIGGFEENPQNRNQEGRSPNEVSVTYWLKRFLSECEKDHDKTRAQELAEKLALMAFRGKGNLKAIKEVIDRVEGPAKNYEDITINGELGLDVSDEAVDLFNAAIEALITRKPTSSEDDQD